MRLEDINRILKEANELHKIKLYAKASSGNKIKLWTYCCYKRKSLKLPAMRITDSKPTSKEIIFLRNAINQRDKLEFQENENLSLNTNKTKISELMSKWQEQYKVKSSYGNADIAKRQFIAANGDIEVGLLNRKHLIKFIDFMKNSKTQTNSLRTIAAYIRAFANWAEQRGYCNKVETKNLMPPEQFGEVKALKETEFKVLAKTPCENPDVKDLFMLGVYTAQRMGEIKQYTFKILEDCQIKVRQGKTGKFIIIPLSAAALNIVKRLKKRREKEGSPTSAKSLIFNLPTSSTSSKIFRRWLESAGLPQNRITQRNSRSTAISLLINKGVSISITQELANHADLSTTAKYYRQIDDRKKREALELIPEF